MFTILARFTEKRPQAQSYAESHDAWVNKNFEDGIILAMGRMTPPDGAVILAKADDKSQLEARIQADPWVAHGIITVEIIEFAPFKTHPALAHLQEG